MPLTVLKTGDIAMKKLDRTLCLYVAHILIDGQETEVKCIVQQRVISKVRKQAQEPK